MFGRIAALAAWLMLFGPAAAPDGPAPPLDVTKIVKQVSVKWEAAREYMFEGELLLEGQRGSGPGRVLSKTKVKLAVAQPGKYLLRMQPADKDEYLLISDSRKSWAYVPKLKQYTEEEGALIGEADEEGESGGAASDDERDLGETFSRLVAPTLARLYGAAHAADTDGYGDVKYENKKNKWPIVRVLGKKDEQGQSLTELTIDPETLRIGRMVLTNLSYSNGEKLVVRMTLDFSSIHAGEELPDSTFRFEPPKNAKRVDALPIPGQTGSFLLNRPAPDFELKTLEGDRIRLAELRGRPVLLAFWASWCPPCRRELLGLADLQEEFGEGKLLILGVNDEGRSVARSYAKQAGLTFRTLDDSDLKAHRLYRVRSIPTMFLIDSEGKIVRFLRGAHDPEAVKAALKSAGL